MNPSRRIIAAATALSFGTGALDAFAFQQLGGIFTANMTGNVMLAGMFNRGDFVTTLLDAGAALLAFTIGLFIGFAVLIPRPSAKKWVQHPSLLAAVVIQIITALTWWRMSGDVPWLRLFMVVMLSMSLALQTVWSTSQKALVGVTTTYVTGVMTSIARDVVRGENSVWLRVGTLGALLTGAIAATGVLEYTPRLVPIVPLVATCLATVLAVRDEA